MVDALLNGLSFLLALAALSGTVAFLHEAVKAGRGEDSGLVAWMRRQMGLPKINGLLILIGGLLWALIAVTLVVGLFWLIVSVLFTPVIPQEARTDLWAFRFKLAQVAVLTTVLGAVIALPITLNRVRLAWLANENAEDRLFNDKITEAAADLYAQRQVTRKDKKNDGKLVNGWEDDITRRNAAIDRLEGLVKERPAEAERVSRLLSVYVRELSREHPAKPVPETEDRKEIRDWARALTPVRSDMEHAVQVLGRLADIPDVAESDIFIDLRGANLQGFDLSGDEFNPLKFPNRARFDRAQLQNANLRSLTAMEALFLDADLRCSRLFEAKLIGSNLRRAVFDFADLGWSNLTEASALRAQLVYARLQGATLRMTDLSETVLIRADLRQARFDSTWLFRADLSVADLSDASIDQRTKLDGIALNGALVSGVSHETIEAIRPYWQEVFADGSVAVSANKRPAHWASQVLRFNPFYRSGPLYDAWRAWQREIGFDPDDPDTW